MTVLINKLLEAKFIVIADYPYNARKIGDVINGVSCLNHYKHLKRYPNLFKEIIQIK